MNFGFFLNAFVCVNTGFLKDNVVISTHTEYTSNTQTFIKSM